MCGVYPVSFLRISVRSRFMNSPSGEGNQRFRTRSRDMSAASAQSRVVAYLPGLRTILQRLRATSSSPSSLHSSLYASPLPTTTSALPPHHLTSSPLTDGDLVAIGLHPSFPLPGAIGVAPPIPEDTPSQETTPTQEASPIPPALTSVTEKDHGLVECLVQQCAPSLQNGFMELFPGVRVDKGQLLVITLCERTSNDMTGWSPAVEEERELLMEHFIESAKEICARLLSTGHWADFIDPYSGRAFYGPHSNSVLFETDERLRYLGFNVLDLGCCRSISHPTWGSHAFVGIIFTNTAIHSPTIQSILEL